MEVLGVDHIDLTVTDVTRSTRFYEKVLGTLGFTRVAHDSYIAWSNGRATHRSEAPHCPIDTTFPLA